MHSEPLGFEAVPASTLSAIVWTEIDEWWHIKLNLGEWSLYWQAGMHVPRASNTASLRGHGVLSVVGHGPSGRVLYDPVDAT